jgi:hypothetical protein
MLSTTVSQELDKSGEQCLFNNEASIRNDGHEDKLLTSVHVW